VYVHDTAEFSHEEKRRQSIIVDKVDENGELRERSAHAVHNRMFNS
jgi:hypothetical protein